MLSSTKNSFRKKIRILLGLLTVIAVANLQAGAGIFGLW